MRPWRDKRSLPLLFFGLAFLFLAVKPLTPLQEALSWSGSFLLPLAKALQPFRPASRPAPAGAAVPDANWLVQKESAFYQPQDPRLIARQFLFASRRSDAAEPDTMWFDAGSKNGVQQGMLAIVGEALLGEVAQVEPTRCLVRTSCHPLSQIGARAGETRLIAAGGRHGTMRVELPSDRGIEAGEEVRGDPVPAILGRLEKGANGKKGAFLIRPLLSTASVSGAWILRQEETPGGKGTESIVAPSPGSWAGAAGLWPEVSPHACGGLFRAEASATVSLGAAVQAEGRFFGIVERVNREMIWVRSLGDPALRFDAMLVRDNGAIVPLPGLATTAGEPKGWRFTPGRAGADEGWLFTAAGKPGIPKGLLVGRVRKDEQGLYLERFVQGFPGKVAIFAGLGSP